MVKRKRSTVDDTDKVLTVCSHVEVCRYKVCVGHTPSMQSIFAPDYGWCAHPYDGQGATVTDVAVKEANDEASRE